MAKQTDKKTVEAIEPAEVEAPEPTALEVEQDIEAEEVDLLADLPPLADPKRLRIRQQNALMRVRRTAAPAMKLLRDRGTEDPEAIEAILTASEDIDEWAESIAVDKDAYADWAEGKGAGHFIAILSRYLRARGE